MTIGYCSGAAPDQAKVIIAKLDLSLSSNVGVAFDVQDKAFPVVKEVFGGLLEIWNSSCPPEEAVQVFDRLVEVDGESGSKTELCDRLTRHKDAASGFMELKFRRPKEKKVTLTKVEGKEFGITLNYFKSSMKVIIAGLDEDGIVQDWNRSHPELQVLEQDAIIEVNGIRDTPTNMVSEMKRSPTPMLTLLQYS